MRIEPAVVLSAIGSLLPGFLISLLGDGRAQYGMMLLLIVLPFYCAGVLFFVFLVNAARRRLGLMTMRSYLVSAIGAGFLAAWFVALDGGAWSAAAFGVSVTVALALVPLIQGPQGRAVG